jgi:hypothetical protein
MSGSRLCAPLIWAILLLAAAPAIADGDPLASLVARARAAVSYGHAQAHAIHATGTIDIGGLAGTVEFWTGLSNGRYAERIIAGPLGSAQGFDGVTSWHQDAKGVVLLQNAPAATVEAANRHFEIMHTLLAPDYGGAEVSYLGARTEGGKSYEAITVKPQNGYPMEWWFDSATALPARRIVTVGGSTTTEILADYESVKGEMIPRSQIVERDNEFTETIVLTSINGDAADLEQHLRRPVSSPDDYSLAGDQAQVPMELVDKQLFVDILINGQGPFHFLFDSGATNIIDPTVVYQIGGRVIASLHTMRGAGTRVQEMQYIQVDSIALGAATLSKQFFSVTQIGPRTDYIPFGNTPRREIQGLIGYEFLARFEVTVDYEHSQLVLHTPQSASQPSAHLAVSSVPLLFDHTHAFVSCALAAVPGYCLIDSGTAIGAAVTKPFIDAHPQVLPRWFTTASAYISGIGGWSRVRAGKLASLQLGASTISDVDAAFSLADKGALADPFFSALVGNPVLKRFTVTFDYPEGTMRLSPAADFGAR